MSVPPGVRFVLGHVPYFAIPSTVTYIVLKTVQHQTKLAIPPALLILISVLARPIFFFVQHFYSEWEIERAAAAQGAVVAPQIQESMLSVLQKMGDGFVGYPADFLNVWSKTYGQTFRFNLLTTKFLATHEPGHVKAVLATQFNNFDKGPTLISQLSSLLGTGVFNSDGEMWKFHRSMSRPFFSKERISDFQIYDRNCTMSLHTAKKRLAEGYSIDFQDLVARFTLDSATEFLFGGNPQSVSAPIPYPRYSAVRNEESVHGHPSSVFTDAFMNGLTATVSRMNMGDFWPLTEMTADSVAPARRIMDEFIEPLIQKALERGSRELMTHEEMEKEIEEETFIDHLVKHTQDPVVIKDEVINLLLAGRDTTMCLLSFAVYMLAEHPDIEQRLREEMYEKVGQSESPSYRQMHEMKYMRAFINETLRLYPPVPNNSRVCNKATVLPPIKPGEKPIYLSANTTVLYSVANMHRRTDLWGPDALKFDPDRFLDERVKKYYTSNPFIFAPFNAGPRICVGQQFAYHEATFYLVRLLQQFTGFELDQKANVPVPAEWASGEGLKRTEKICPMQHVTMYVKGGLWIRMKELKGAGV